MPEAEDSKPGLAETLTIHFRSTRSVDLLVRTTSVCMARRLLIFTPVESRMPMRQVDYRIRHVVHVVAGSKIAALNLRSQSMTVS